MVAFGRTPKVLSRATGGVIDCAVPRATCRVSSDRRGRTLLWIGRHADARRPSSRTAWLLGGPHGVIVGTLVAAADLVQPLLLCLFPSFPARMRRSRVPASWRARSRWGTWRPDSGLRRRYVGVKQRGALASHPPRQVHQVELGGRCPAHPCAQAQTSYTQASGAKRGKNKKRDGLWGHIFFAGELLIDFLAPRSDEDGKLPRSIRKVVICVMWQSLGRSYSLLAEPFALSRFGAP